MKVKDIIMYQIAINRNYKAGQTFFIGDSDNGQAARVKNSKFYINKGQSLANYLKEKYNGNEFTFSPDELKNIGVMLGEYDFVVRELAFEEIRKEKFSHLPSRLKCMYLYGKKDFALNDVDAFLKTRENVKSLQVVSVKLDGEIFMGDISSKLRVGESFENYKNMGEQYWMKETILDSDEKCEYLFVGNVEIVEVIDKSALIK